MGSSSQAEGVSPEFLRVFRAHADATGTMPFARFMDLALYHPDVGYYRQARPRVGYGAGTDFFTATSSGAIFGEMVSAACVTLLGDRDPRAHRFVEIGAEPGRSVLAGVAHPFRDVCTLRVGETLALSGPCVVFSNELLDAQPCTSTVFRDGDWREIGVRLQDGRLREVELPVAARFRDAPATSAEGYRFDRSDAAAALVEALAAQNWTGLFVAIDYGKTLRELTAETPAGTLRAYHRHRQSNDVLALPGEQDLTCHVCWDWMSEALRRHGFGEPRLDFQETFFVRHAGGFLAATAEAEAAGLSKRKLALLQLLHPAHLGQKFQVLHAVR